MKKLKEYFSMSLSFIAIIISIIAVSLTYSDSKDKQTNSALYLKISEYKALIDYQNRIDTVFRENSKNIITLFERVKGPDYVIQHEKAIRSIYLSKVLYDLVNDSYKDFFTHHGMLDLYNSVGKSITIGEVLIYSHIFWNSTNYNDISNYDIDRIMEKETFIIDDTNKREAVNNLLEGIKRVTATKYIEIEQKYENVLYNRNLDKDLVDNYFKLNSIYVGLTLSQVEWFNNQDANKMRIVDSYIESYFSSYMIPYYLESLKKK